MTTRISYVKSDLLNTCAISSSTNLVRLKEGQLLERGALPRSLPVVRLRIPLGAGISETYHISPLSILGHCFDVVSLGKAIHPHMLHLTQVKMSTW